MEFTINYIVLVINGMNRTVEEIRCTDKTVGNEINAAYLRHGFTIYLKIYCDK